MKSFGRKNLGRNLALWLIIAIPLFVLFHLFQTPSARHTLPQMAYSDFIAEVDEGLVREVHVYGKVLSGHLSDGRAFTTNEPGDPNLVQRLLDEKVTIESVEPDESTPTFLNILVSWLPLLVIAGMWFYYIRRCRTDGGGTSLDIQVRLEQMEAQMRALSAQLGEIQSKVCDPPSRVDEAQADNRPRS